MSRAIDGIVGIWGKIMWPSELLAISSVKYFEQKTSWELVEARQHEMIHGNSDFTSHTLHSQLGKSTHTQHPLFIVHGGGVVKILRRDNNYPSAANEGNYNCLAALHASTLTPTSLTFCSYFKVFHQIRVPVWLQHNVWKKMTFKFPKLKKEQKLQCSVGSGVKKCGNWKEELSRALD